MTPVGRIEAGSQTCSLSWGRSEMMASSSVVAFIVCCDCKSSCNKNIDIYLDSASPIINLYYFNQLLKYYLHRKIATF